MLDLGQLNKRKGIMYDIKPKSNIKKEKNIFKFLINYLEQCKEYQLEKEIYNISDHSRIITIIISKEYKNKLHNLIFSFQENIQKNTNRVEVNSYNYSLEADPIQTNFNEVMEDHVNYRNFYKLCNHLISNKGGKNDF
jgi:hypothetical protein